MHKNPGIIDTVEGISLLLGASPDLLESEIRDLSDLGLLKTKRLVTFVAISLDRERDKGIYRSVGEYLDKAKPAIYDGSKQVK
ncbi:MAG: hypothetical protein ACYC7D_04385 [Nitrososphaerales archaeon]